MRAGNSPNSYTRNGLTPNGGRHGAPRPDRLRRGTRPGLPELRARRFSACSPQQHAPAAQVVAGAFEDVAGDVDELVGPSGRVSVDAGPSRPPRPRPSQASGKRTASRSGTGTAISGPDVAPDGAGARIPGRLEVLTGADRTRAFTLSRGGLAVAG